MVTTLLLMMAIVSIVLSDRVIIRPDTTHPFIGAKLIKDPRGNNKVTNTNLWRLRGSPSTYKRENDWALALKLSAEEFGFKPYSDNSSVSITTRGFCTTKYCDTYYAFQFGDQYITFSIDNYGYSIYPACGGRVAKGYASALIQKINNNDPDVSDAEALRAALAGGDINNWHRIDKTENDPVFPNTIELINNDGQGTFTVRFVTDEYPAGMDCFYFKVNTGTALSMYMTPGWNEENLVLRSFEINGDRYKSSPTERLEANEEHYWEPNEDQVEYETRLYRFSDMGFAL